MIITEMLTQRFSKNVVALDGLTLAIQKGMFGLLGPNGAGKTTLMRILCTLLPPTSGQVSILGLDLRRQADEIRQQLGYLPQDFHAYPTLTGREFLHYVADLKGIRGAKRKGAVEEVLEMTNLTEAAGRRSGGYSGGMKRRLGIAQALLGNPSVLVVDEPTAGLDPEERVRFRNLLADLSGDRIVILSTHITEDVESTCGSLAVLNRGTLRFQGSPEALTRKGEGFVWEMELSAADYEQVKHKVRTVSTRRTASSVFVRAIAPENPGGRAVPPSLEEGYLVLQEEVTA